MICNLPLSLFSIFFCSLCVLLIICSSCYRCNNGESLPSRTKKNNFPAYVMAVLEPGLGAGMVMQCFCRFLCISGLFSVNLGHLHLCKSFFFFFFKCRMLNFNGSFLLYILHTYFWGQFIRNFSLILNDYLFRLSCRL